MITNTGSGDGVVSFSLLTHCVLRPLGSSLIEAVSFILAMTSPRAEHTLAGNTIDRMCKPTVYALSTSCHGVAVGAPWRYRGPSFPYGFITNEKINSVAM